MADARVSGPVAFPTVLAAELAAIRDRREAQGQLPSVDPDDAPRVNPANPKSGPLPSTKRGLTGVALSGGGIRSAAFSLGVLQALDVMKVIPRTDYFSTVSGGGYIGGATVLGMSEAEDGKFPFASKLGEKENPNLAHVRDFSNYLLVGGFKATARAIGNIVAGFAANTLVVLPIILLFAAATIGLNQNRESLTLPVAWDGINLLGISGNYAISLNLLLLCLAIGGVALLLGYVWETGAKAREGLRWFWFLLLAAPLFFAFTEFQPAAMAWLWDRWDSVNAADEGGNPTGLLGAIAAILTTFAPAIGRFLASPGQRSSGMARILAPIRRVVLFLIVGLVVPLLLWFAYLGLSIWGTFDYGMSIDVCDIPPPSVTEAAVAPTPILVGAPLSPSPDLAVTENRSLVFGAPGEISEIFCRIGFDLAGVRSGNPMWVIYLIAAALLFFSWLFIPANAYSLHYLYRDRIVSAFLRLVRPGETDKSPVLDERMRKKLSTIDIKRTPYPLINSALNIHGAKEVNQRGRDADFFLFSPRYTGSALTGYCDTERLEGKAKGLNLGGALTISGAAVSASVGARVNAFLVFSLAILNIRLGYWMPNPHYAETRHHRWSRTLGPFWFLREAFGFLHHKSWLAFLTDGGQIDNLGLYELIRRRCAVIVVVDSEADPDMVMPAFVKAQRFARIDMGVRIELEWDLVCARSKAFDPAEHYKGPHAAMGLIYYGEDSDTEVGLLIYLKASVSGDEADYVREYKRRYPTFPNETTLDQFFSEEQFEAYRALGFHIAHRLLAGEDEVQGLSDPKQRNRLHALARERLDGALGITASTKWVARKPKGPTEATEPATDLG